MDAGGYRDRVKIELCTRTQTATGWEETWSDVQTRWARVIALDPAARARYAQIESEVTHKVVFHGAVTLAIADNRLVWLTRGAKVLELLEPPRDPDGLGRHTEVAVREARADGS
ncbi:MAG TPA: head-tail adaptor protein [Planctomycetota bacterium]|nr:head-tail adaptor protein [Planctomycetota bacterium]